MVSRAGFSKTAQVNEERISVGLVIWKFNFSARDFDRFYWIREMCGIWSFQRSLEFNGILYMCVRARVCVNLALNLNTGEFIDMYVD